MVLTAEEIMFSPPPIRIDTDLKAVHEMMQELEATMLPVTDTEKNLKGVVTLMDVLDGLGRERQSMSLLQRIFS
ncbi:MAG: CBS domain-containing protein [Candidatus Heimdallarchaeota archaeon]|nr:CBS domain-containing protein [Candidatus Heimdallarchaeota archaeon]